MDLPLQFIYPKKGIIMPLVRDENKDLHCLRCGNEKDDAIAKYGWNMCEDCYRYNELMTKTTTLTYEQLANKHKKHKKPCCTAKFQLMELGLA